MKTFAIKLGLFLLILLTLQVVVSVLYPPDLPEEILQLNAYLEDGVDIIYFGDSTVSYPRGDLTTGEILQNLLPRRTVGEISHPAYSLDLYLSYVRVIIRSDHRPEAVIIPINLRSFSPEWDLRPGYQFEEEKTLLAYGLGLSTILYKPLDTLDAFSPRISRETFLQTTVYNGDAPVGVVADFEERIGAPLDGQDRNVEFAYRDNLPAADDIEALRSALIYYYMADLNPAHRKLSAMLRINKLLQANDIEPIFYITPINYELGERHLDEAFSEQLATNTELIESLLRDRGGEVINMVFDLAAFHFVDTEHMRESGKNYIAEQLAQRLEPDAPLLTANDPPDSAPTASPSVRASSPLAPVAPLADAATNTPSPTSRPTNPPPPTDTPLATQASLTETAQRTLPIVAATASLVIPTAPPAAPTPRPPTTTPSPEPSPTPSPTNTRVLGPPVDRAQLGKLVSAEFLSTTQPAGNYTIDIYRLRFQTLDEDNQLVEVQANLYFPRVTEATAFPVLVYGAGTTGLSNGCAPLDERGSGRNWGLYHAHMLSYAGQGYIGVLPNWIGFEDPGRTHPYFIAELQARVMLDAARAAYNFFADPPSPEILADPLAAVFFGGYSSGGHAAFAAKDFAVGYAPDLPVKGVVGHGPTTDIEVLMRENTIFIPYLIFAYRQFYGESVISPADVFLPGWLPTFDADVTGQCIDEIFVHYSYSARQMYNPQFNDALYDGRLQSLLPDFKAVLEANAAGLSPTGTDIPVLILQGTADTVVTPPSQAQFAADLCRLGNSVTYMLYPAVSHPDIRRESFRDTVTWMDSIAAGIAPESDCTSLLGQ